MTAPVAPTLALLTAEGIKKAGITSTSSTQYSTILTRAQDSWMEEIKNDMYLLEKQLVSLQTTYVHVTTEGLSKYSLPTDYGINMTMTLLDGSSTGTFQAGSTTASWVLDSTEDATEADLLGKEILVYASTATPTTAKGQLGQVTDYNATTKAAAVSGCTVAPATADSYVIIDNYYELFPFQAWEYDQMSNQKMQGTPNRFSLIGDADDGEFLIYPVPYRSSSSTLPWGIKQRYYADLMRVDLASTLITEIYRRWRNLFIQGVKAKCLEFLSDPRAQAEMQVYWSVLNTTLMSEKYGVDAPADINFAPQFR